MIISPSTVYMIDLLCLTVWLTDWQADKLINNDIDWLGMTGLLANWWTDWQADELELIDVWLMEWLANWHTDWQADQYYTLQLIDWQL